MIYHLSKVLVNIVFHSYEGILKMLSTAKKAEEIIPIVSPSKVAAHCFGPEKFFVEHGAVASCNH